MTNFFKSYADNYLKPDCRRKREDGDYYGSPLQSLGRSREDAYKIDPSWMCREINKEGPHRHVTLGDLAHNNLRFRETRNSVINCRNHIVNIFSSEALLHVFSHDKKTGLHNSNFFDGAHLYFDDKEKPNTIHKLNENTYRLFLMACLSLIWLEYKNQKKTIPENNHLNRSHIQIYKKRPENKDKKLMKVNKSKLLEIEDDNIFQCYKTIYKHCYSGLEKHLDNILQRYERGENNSTQSIFRLNGEPPEFMNGPFYVAFNSEPFKFFFRRHNNKINYAAPHDPEEVFTFYKQHSRGMFWDTLLLIDLYEHLKSESKTS